MLLNYREMGEGKPVVILHGLYGSSDNWMTVAHKLSSNFRVIALDMRNHGRSPHSDVHTYPVMVADVSETLIALGINQAHVIGHSMGGRVAMLLNSLHPNLVEKLIVVDIAPFVSDVNATAYKMVLAEHRRILRALSNVPIATISTRAQAEALLSTKIPLPSLRQFLLKSLRRDKNGKFSWDFNLEVLSGSVELILQGVQINPSPLSRVLAIKGAKSIYLQPEQIDQMRNIYPCLQFVEIPDAGHWVHFEQPEMFMECITDFLCP